MYNFYVTPPGGGSEYAILSKPSVQAVVTLSSLPVGVSTVRALAIDLLGDSGFSTSVSVNVTAAAVNSTVLTALLATGSSTAQSTGDVNSLVALIQSLTGALSDPAAYGNISAADQVTLRQELTQAVNLTITLAGTLDADTTTVLVGALQSIVGSSANIDDSLFTLLLSLVQALASNAGNAASNFLSLVTAMLQSRGVGNNNNAQAISSSLASLSLSLLEDAVCGQAPSTLSTSDVQLLAAFQSSFGGSSVPFTGGASLVFGNDFGNFANGSTVLDDSICKKSQVLSQNTAPYVAPTGGAFMYARDDRAQQGGAGGAAHGGVDVDNATTLTRSARRRRRDLRVMCSVCPKTRRLLP